MITIYRISHRTDTQKKGELEIIIKNMNKYVNNDIESTVNRLAVNSFQQEASKAQLDLTGDSEETQKLSKQLKRWDRKKKKMVTVNQVS